MGTILVEVGEEAAMFHFEEVHLEDGGPDGEITVYIDDQELSLGEFGRLLLTHAGWGMRIAFVPDDLVEEEPEVEVREPRDGER